jgi:hypothetical protein
VEKIKIETYGYKVDQKKAKLTSTKSTSCVIYVPKDWHNKNVTVILNENLADDSSR